MRITRLSNEQLLASLTSLAGRERRLLIHVLSFVGEVEERRLHLDRGYSSMFDFCRRKLGYSEGESYRRIAGARLMRRFPQLRDMLASGAIRLTNLVLLVPVLDEESFDSLLSAIRGKTKKEVERLVAGLRPKRDVPDAIRPIKGQSIWLMNAGAAVPAATNQDSPSPSAAPGASTSASASAEGCGDVRLPVAIASATPAASSVTTTAVAASQTTGAPVSQAPAATADASPTIDAALPILQQALVALSADRFKVTFTASDELRLLLEKARGLMRHQNPKGDLATIIECALKLLIAHLEKRKFGKTSRPRKSEGPSDPADVSRETLRAVSERDAEQCAYVAKDGARCPARELLEVDHRQARALGGSGDVANVRLLCRAHNQREAEKAFGRAHIERKKRLRQETPRAVGATLDLGLVAESVRNDLASSHPDHHALTKRHE